MDVSGATGEINVWTNLSQSEMNFYVEEFNKRVPGVKVTVTVMPGNEYRTNSRTHSAQAPMRLTWPPLKFQTLVCTRTPTCWRI